MPKPSTEMISAFDVLDKAAALAAVARSAVANPNGHDTTALDGVEFTLHEVESLIRSAQTLIAHGGWRYQGDKHARHQ